MISKLEDIKNKLKKSVNFYIYIILYVYLEYSRYN